MANSFQNQHSPSPDSVLGFAERECQLPAGSWPIGKHISDDFEKQIVAVDAANRSSSETSIGFQTSAASEALHSGSGLPPLLSSAATAVRTRVVSLGSPFYFGQRCSCPTDIHGARKQIFDLVRIQLRQLIEQRSKQVLIYRCRVRFGHLSSEGCSKGHIGRLFSAGRAPTRFNDMANKKRAKAARFVL